jgi:hypothetical protein
MVERSERIAASREDALVDAYLERQHDLETRGVIPTPRRDWLARRGLLEWLAAVQVAFVVGTFSVFLTFLLFNFIFHVGS